MNSSGKVKCTCGWSWNKSDSSKKDMYICHECGRDNSNNMKNGGWLDSYADGGTMQEHQENYNDNSVSLPEGYVGEGYDTTGRNYSPAWGGQFEEGGEILMAQNGNKKPLYVKSKNDPRYKAYQDSLSLYKSTPIRVAELKKINKKIVDDIAKKTNRVLKSEMVKVGNEPFNKNRNRGYYQDDNKMILGHDSSIKPISFDKYQMKKLDGSGLFKYFDGNNIQTDDFGVYKKPQQPVIVKPKPKPKQQQVIQPDLPRVEAISLPPMQQLASITPPTTSDVVRQPKSYNVSALRYNMKGPSDYYNYNQEGVDYETAMKAKAASDAYNADIEKRYGPQNEYRTPKSAAEAAERLKQLRSEFNITPNYAMGGSIPGSVGFSYARTNDPAPSNGPYAKKTMASAQNGVKTKNYFPEYKNIVSNSKKEKLKESLKERPREVVRDNTAVVTKVEKGKQKTVNPNKQVSTKHNAEKQRKEIVAERKAKIKDSILAQDEDVIGNPNWREVMARETQATGDKFRLFPEEDSFIDNYLNPAVMIGNMASNLGQAPYQAQQQDSYMPYVTSIGTPLAVGALAGLGTNSKGQFLNNLFNPLAGTKDVFNNIRPPRNILVDEKYMGNNSMLNALDEVKSTTLPSKTKLNELREAVEYDELWKYPKDLNPIDEIERLKKAAKTEADIAYVNALEKQYDKNISWHDASRNRANPVFVTGQSIEDLVNPAFKNPQGDQWFGIKPFKYTAPKGKNLGYIADEADYIFGSQYRLPGNRFDTEAMLRDMGESANESFNSMYKPFNVNIKDIPMNKNGGVIKDDMGQWNHPGEITEIGSNQITMEGVPYDVLGISDTGDTKLMKPGKNYKFKGKKVTEYPMAKNGLRQEQKGLVNLDQLTNFTNYNTKQPGGWLDKY
jgi:hypothetical protein